MPSYWPDGIDLMDSATPLDILREAQQEWVSESSGILSLVIQVLEPDKSQATYVLHAAHVPTNRTATLFSVTHREELPYPASIKPIDPRLPDDLKRRRKVGVALRHGLEQFEVRVIENEWVCDSPKEFRDKLQKVFNLEGVKAEVQGLLSCPADARQWGTTSPEPS